MQRFINQDINTNLTHRDLAALLPDRAKDESVNLIDDYDHTNVKKLKYIVKEYLKTCWLEVLVSLEGEEPITGAAVEARNSYAGVT